MGNSAPGDLAAYSAKAHKTDNPAGPAPRTAMRCSDKGLLGRTKQEGTVLGVVVEDMIAIVCRNRERERKKMEESVVVWIFLVFMVYPNGGNKTKEYLVSCLVSCSWGGKVSR